MIHLWIMSRDMMSDGPSTAPSFSNNERKYSKIREEAISRLGKWFSGVEMLYFLMEPGGYRPIASILQRVAMVFVSFYPGLIRPLKIVLDCD